MICCRPEHLQLSRCKTRRQLGVLARCLHVTFKNNCDDVNHTVTASCGSRHHHGACASQNYHRPATQVLRKMAAGVIWPSVRPHRIGRGVGRWA